MNKIGIPTSLPWYQKTAFIVPPSPPTKLCFSVVRYSKAILTHVSYRVTALGVKICL